MFLYTFIGAKYRWEIPMHRYICGEAFILYLGWLRTLSCIYRSVCMLTSALLKGNLLSLSPGFSH